jgi:rubrerythrin
MHPQHHKNHDNPQMEIAKQRMVEIHTRLMRVMTQDMVNRDSKKLPPRMQQVLDDHSSIVQMMSQILARTNNNLPQNNLGSKEPRGDAEITLRACKICGEIGHTSKECHEQCPYCDMNHPIGKCPMAQVTSFLCNGINHVPVECKIYPMVQ